MEEGEIKEKVPSTAALLWPRLQKRLNPANTSSFWQRLGRAKTANNPGWLDWLTGDPQRERSLFLLHRINYKHVRSKQRDLRGSSVAKVLLWKQEAWVQNPTDTHTHTPTLGKQKQDGPLERPTSLVSSLFKERPYLKDYNGEWCWPLTCALREVHTHTCVYTQQKCQAPVRCTYFAHTSSVSICVAWTSKQLPKHWVLTPMSQVSCLGAPNKLGGDIFYIDLSYLKRGTEGDSSHMAMRLQF